MTASLNLAWRDRGTATLANGIEDYGEFRTRRRRRPAGRRQDNAHRGASAGDGTTFRRIIEGDAPADFGELVAYVTVPLPRETSLFVRVRRERHAEARARVETMRRLLGERDGVERFVAELLGPELALTRGRQGLLDTIRSTLTTALEHADSLPPASPTEQWAVRPGYEGIERAGLVIVNLRSEDDAGGAARVLDDLVRLRRDRALFDDVLGWRGSRRPITAVAADLADPRHAGTRKAVARLRRVVNAAAGQPESTWE